MYGDIKHIHFVGIGGIGMSGIATVLVQQGYTVSGCDTDVMQKTVQTLKSHGCIVHEGNNTMHCADSTIDLLVYSSAIKKNSPEILAAQHRGIPTIHRALMLAELMRTKCSIAVTGAHGKTTTTAIIAHILMYAKYNPTVIVGVMLHGAHAACMLFSDCLISGGIIGSCGACASTKNTVWCGLIMVPAVGIWLKTVPGTTSGSYLCPSMRGCSVCVESTVSTSWALRPTKFGNGCASGRHNIHAPT